MLQVLDPNASPADRRLELVPRESRNARLQSSDLPGGTFVQPVGLSGLRPVRIVLMR